MGHWPQCPSSSRPAARLRLPGRAVLLVCPRRTGGCPCSSPRGTQSPCAPPCHKQHKGGVLELLLDFVCARVACVWRQWQGWQDERQPRMPRARCLTSQYLRPRALACSTKHLRKLYHCSRGPNSTTMGMGVPGPMPPSVPATLTMQWVFDNDGGRGGHLGYGGQLGYRDIWWMGVRHANTSWQAGGPGGMLRLDGHRPSTFGERIAGDRGSALHPPRRYTYHTLRQRSS